MEIKQLTNKIRIDTGKQIYNLTLSELKEQFQEKRLKFQNIHWNVYDNYIVFSASIYSYKYGVVNQKILFDTQKGVFTGEHTCIRASVSEMEKVMAEVVLNGQSYEILWDDLRKHFDIPLFRANGIIYESNNYVVHFKVYCRTKSYLFDFDMKNGTIGNYRMLKNEDAPVVKSECTKMMDYKVFMYRTKKVRGKIEKNEKTIDKTE